MISKHKTYLLPGRNEGRSKSTFRQLRISTLWTSKGYKLHYVEKSKNRGQIRIKSLDPLRAKKIFIRKPEDGPYLGFGYKSLISDPIRSGNRSRKKIL